MTSLQKAGAYASLGQAAIYTTVFAYYGAFLQVPADANMAEKLAYLAEHQLSLTLITLLAYVAFGLLLAILVLSLHARLKDRAPLLAQFGALAGMVWVVLVIASGMIANAGLAAAIKLAVAEPEQARALWVTINAIVDGLGGGNELIGGIWVLLVSVAALKAGLWPRALHGLGLLVGTVGVLTLYPDEMLTAVFGLSQIVWFAWLGISLLRK